MKIEIVENRWNPFYYFENSSLQLKHAKALIDKHAFSGVENILDIGCGDGKITAALGQLIPYGKIVGIDKSVEMIDFASQQFLSSEFSNVRFDVLDARNINYENQFDLIVSFSCLHFVPNEEQLDLLKGVRRALKQNGKLLLMLYRKCPAQWAAVNSVANHDRWKDYFKKFTSDFHEYLPESYQALLDRADLGRFSAAFTPVEYVTYASQEMVSKFIKGWLPHMQMLPQKFHDEFIDEVVVQYLNNLGLKQGEPVRTPFMRLVVC
jgi:trans-aconitate 2-methyltransferase